MPAFGYSRPMTKRVGLMVIVWSMSSAVAAAQEEQRSPQETQAQAEFQAATDHYDNERWSLAAQSYQRSFDLLAEIDHPRRGWVAYNIGRSLEHLPGRERDALAAYRTFLSLTTDDSSNPEGAEQRALARSRIEEIVARGGGGGGMSPVGPALVGIGAAILVAGAGTGIGALVMQGDILAVCGERTCPESQRGAASTMEALAIATDVLLPIGAVAAALGVVLMFALTAGGSETASVHVGAAVSANEAFASLSVDF